MKRRIYKLGISPAEVRSKFGDLRFRKTWEAAYAHYIKNEVVTTQQSQPKDNECKVVPVRPVIEKVVNRDRDSGNEFYRDYKKDKNGQFLLFNIEAYRQNNVIPFKPTIRKGRVKRQKSFSQGKKLLLFEVERIKAYAKSDNLWAEEFPEIANMFEQWARI